MNSFFSSNYKLTSLFDDYDPTEYFGEEPEETEEPVKEEPSSFDKIYYEIKNLKEEIQYENPRRKHLTNAQMLLNHKKYEALDSLVYRNKFPKADMTIEEFSRPIIKSMNEPIDWVVAGKIAMESDASLDHRVITFWYNPDDTFNGTFTQMVRHNNKKETYRPYSWIKLSWAHPNTNDTTLMVERANRVRNLTMCAYTLMRDPREFPCLEDAMMTMSNETTGSGIEGFTQYTPLVNLTQNLMPRAYVEAYTRNAKQVIVKNIT